MFKKTDKTSFFPVTIIIPWYCYG